MSDPELFRRYADLLEGDAAELAPLAGQLDSFYTALEPPAHLELAIEWAVRARPVLAASATGTEGAQPRHSDARSRAQTERRTFVKSRHLQTFAACAAALVVVALMAALLLGRAGVFLSGQPAGPGKSLSTTAKQQLFAQLGGTSAIVVMQCPMEGPSCDLSKAIQETIPLLTERLSAAFNMNSMLVLQTGPDRLQIELPGVRDATPLLESVLHRNFVAVLDTGATPLVVSSEVSVCSVSCRPGEYKAVFTGVDVDPNGVSAAIDPNNGKPVVMFAFKGAARTRFADYTRTHIGQFLTIALDNTVIESATIQSEITGSAEILGLATLDDARLLAFSLRHGALPVAMASLQVERVNPPGTPPASGVSCGQGTPLPTPTPERGSAPTATSAIPPTPSATLATIPPTPAATPARSNGTQPTPTAESGGDGCSTPTVRPRNTPTPAATLTPPPTPTVTASPTPVR
jgi:hypothetical protein